MISKKSLISIIEDELSLLSKLNEQPLGNIVTRDEPFGPEGFPEDSLGRPDLGGPRGRGPVHGRFDNPAGGISSENALLAGEIAAGMTPAGIAIDIKDTAQAIKNRDLPGFGLAVVGWLPLGGDWLKGLGKRLRKKGRDIPEISVRDDLTLSDFESWDPRVMEDVAEELGEEGIDALERRGRGLNSHDDAVRRASEEGVPNLKGRKYKKWRAAWDVLDDVEPLRRAEDLTQRLKSAAGAGTVRRQLDEAESVIGDLARRQKALEEGMDAVKGKADHWLEPFEAGLNNQEKVLRELSSVALPAARRTGNLDNYTRSVSKALGSSGLSMPRKRDIALILLGGSVGGLVINRIISAQPGDQGIDTNPSPSPSPSSPSSPPAQEEFPEEARDTGDYRADDDEEDEEDENEEPKTPGDRNVWEGKVKISKKLLERIIKEEIKKHRRSYIVEQVFDNPRMDPDVVTATQVATGELPEPPDWIGTGGGDPYSTAQWGLAIASFFPLAGEAADTASMSLFLAEAVDKKSQGDMPGYEAAMGNAILTAALIPIPLVGTWLNKIIPNSLTGWLFRKLGGGRSPDIDLSSIPGQSDEVIEVIADFERRLDDIGDGSWDEMPIPDRQAAAREAMETQGLPVTTGPHPDADVVTGQINDGRTLAAEVTEQSNSGIKFKDEIEDVSDITVGTGLPPAPGPRPTSGAGARVTTSFAEAMSQPLMRIPRAPLRNRRLSAGVRSIQALPLTKQAAESLISGIRSGHRQVTKKLIKDIGPLGEELQSLSRAAETATRQAEKASGALKENLEHWATYYRSAHDELADVSRQLNRAVFSAGSEAGVDFRVLQKIGQAWYSAPPGSSKKFYEYIGGGRTLLALIGTGSVVAVSRSYYSSLPGRGQELPTSDPATGIDSQTGAVNDEESIEAPDQEASVGTLEQRSAPEVVNNAPANSLEVVDKSGDVVDIAPLVQEAETAPEQLPSGLEMNPNVW
jgi:hypothetical protein